jgi:arsenate reductase (thioredoxin)
MMRELLERNILILCEDNACLSQMAEAAARHLSPPKTKVFSAGVKPSALSAQEVQAMQELGISMAEQKSKGLSEIPLDEIDLIVSFEYADERCGDLPRRARVTRWLIGRLERSAGPRDFAVSPDSLRSLRDEIERRVFALFLDHWRNAPKVN